MTRGALRTATSGYAPVWHASPMPEISDARYRAGQGEPLVLVHGFTATWRCWLPVIPDLVARFEVIA